MNVNKQKKLLRKKIFISHFRFGNMSRQQWRKVRTEKGKWLEKEKRDYAAGLSSLPSAKFAVSFHSHLLHDKIFLSSLKVGGESTMRAGTYSLTEHTRKYTIHELFISPRNFSPHSQLKVPAILISDLFTRSKSTQAGKKVMVRMKCFGRLVNMRWHVQIFFFRQRMFIFIYNL